MAVPSATQLSLTVRSRARSLRPLQRISRPALRNQVRGAEAPTFAILAGLAAIGFNLPAAAFVVAVAALAGGAWRIARSAFRLRVVDAVLLATWTLAVAWLALVAEVLSLGRWLGSSTGWLVACLALYVGSRALPRDDRPLEWRMPLRPLSALGAPGRLLLLAFALPLVTTLLLVWFAGITNGDSLLTYLPRAVRYVQYGTFDVYSGGLDNFQYLHVILVAFPMVFLRTDVHVNVMSFASALLASIAGAAFARSLGWGGWLPLVAAALPWTMPKILLSASISGFDILEGQWLVFALYFLRRGYAGTSIRWLTLAAAATALALATKPTFWFAAPGLAVLWGLVLFRGVYRGRRRLAGWTAAIALVVIFLVGAPFLIRNVLLQGYLVAPPSQYEVLSGQPNYSLQLVERGRTLAMSALGLGLQLLTPPFFLPEAVNVRTNDWLAAAARALNIDEYASGWPDLLRHASERYHSDHAGFGGAFPLVLIPSLLLVPAAARRLGPRRPFVWWIAWTGLSYLTMMGLVIALSPNSNRYVIEAALVLALIGPAVLAVLPRPTRAVVAVVLAVPLILEMYDVAQHDRHLPPAVTAVPREDQVYDWFGWPDPATRQAVKVFNQKYPVHQMPDVYLANPFRPDYPFTGPSLARRVHLWDPPRGDGPVALPGPVLTQDPGLVSRLGSQPDVIAERLSADTWLLLPFTRILVLFGVETPPGVAESQLVLQAHVPAGRFAESEYRAVLLRPGAGEQELRGYDADPHFSIPTSLARQGDIRVDVRGDRSRRQPQERYLLDRYRFVGLDSSVASR